MHLPKTIFYVDWTEEEAVSVVKTKAIAEELILEVLTWEQEEKYVFFSSIHNLCED